MPERFEFGYSEWPAVLRGLSPESMHGCQVPGGVFLWQPDGGHFTIGTRRPYHPIYRAFRREFGYRRMGDRVPRPGLVQDWRLANPELFADWPEHWPRVMSRADVALERERERVARHNANSYNVLLPMP